MAKWTAFPYDAADYRFSAAALKKHWARLHAGDAEPWPRDDAVQEAWALFHAGQFQQAFDAGLKAGGAAARSCPGPSARGFGRAARRGGG